jgi:hypothetical protein
VLTIAGATLLAGYVPARKRVADRSTRRAAARVINDSSVMVSTSGWTCKLTWAAGVEACWRARRARPLADNASPTVTERRELEAAESNPINANF